MPVSVRRASAVLVNLVPVLLVVAASALAWVKVTKHNYSIDQVVRSESYYLETVMEFDGHGSPVAISVALPSDQLSQTVEDESFSSADLKFSTEVDQGNRRGVWRSSGIDGTRRISYTATVLTRARTFTIDSTLPTLLPYPDSVARYLLPDSVCQSDHPQIARLADSLGLSSDLPIARTLGVIFDYTTSGLRYVAYSGMTDALTAYQLGEASCGGKSRLFAALARSQGIPTRLVGGKILSQGASRATHVWVECYVGGHWVPYCPTNDYATYMPSTYLILYYGEQPAITHTRDINFQYFFSLKKRLVQTATGTAAAASTSDAGLLDIISIWATFQQVAISLELLQIILMLPFGVLVVVLFRNLIGVETFGTFMPALLAIGFRDTGLWLGIGLFGTILIVGALARGLLSRMQLLHTPRLAVILAILVLFILVLAFSSVRVGWLDVARVALYPLVILTLTVERFSLIIEESGVMQAVRISLLTLLVTICAYGVMNWLLLQAIVISFPEIILIAIALFIYIGRYAGFRLLEHVRFKPLLTRMRHVHG